VCGGAGVRDYDPEKLYTDLKGSERYVVLSEGGGGGEMLKLSFKKKYLICKAD